MHAYVKGNYESLWSELLKNSKQGFETCFKSILGGKNFKILAVSNSVGSMSRESLPCGLKYINALCLSVLPVVHLEGDCELEDNYARVSCCTGQGSDHERLKNSPNLPFSGMLFYSELEDNYTRGSYCPWVKNGTTSSGFEDEGCVLCLAAWKC